MSEPDADVKIEIVDAADAGLLEQAFRLRYAVSVEEMNKSPTAADHVRKEIRDELDNETSTILCAVAGGEVIATMRLTWGGDGIPEIYRQQFSLDLFKAFPITSFSFSSRLVVHKDWRGTAVLGLMLNHGYALSRGRGSRINFCHCTPSLVRLYEQLGYRRYASAIIDSDVGYHIPLLMLFEDIAHLKRVGSPFLRVARRLDNSPETAEWFNRRFPEYSLGGPQSGVYSEDLSHSLAEQLFDTEIPLFRGMEIADTEKFIKASTVLQCRAQDPIVQRGEVGKEMFLILAGAAEVRREVEQRRYTIATLGQGQIFGEMAFLSNRPRTASIVAITDMEVLVLSQQFFQKLMKTMPEIVVQVLLNLSVVLCDRLNLCTEQLLAQLSAHNDSNETQQGDRHE